ncbi:MAG: DUF3822 family protein [Bacteroidia bacterium]|nr:DUF3822 family protein [Bacteroidia bacterium]
MAAYHNSVSDILVVSFFPGAIFYFVYSKENTLKYCEIQPNSSDIPSAISSSIFSKTTCISVAQNFVLASLSDNDFKAFYNLNFDSFDELKTDELEDFRVIHNLTPNVQHVIKNLVNANVVSDISLVYQAFLQKGYQHAVYFYTVGNTVSIFCIKEGKLRIANRYPADDLDELFYYVMLLIEQMEMPADKVHFECLTSKGRHESYHSLFKNYLPPLNLTNVVVDNSFLPLEHHDLKAEFLQATFFAQCVL